MSKRREQGIGFSNIPESQTSRKKPVQGFSDYSTREQHAVALINQGKLQDAEEIYRELISAGTSNHHVYGNLATLCGMQGRFDELITLIRKALDLNPNYPEAHNNLGVALQDQGDLTAAIASYNNALKLTPNYPEAHNNLGNALREQGDLTAAITSFHNALRLKPNYPEAHNNLGIAFRDKGDLDEALINHKRALELDPKNSNAFYGIGLVLAVKGNLKASNNSLHKSIQLDLSNTRALYELSKNIESKEDLKELAKKLNGVSRTRYDKRKEVWFEFSAANFYHKSKHYANATQHLAKANKLKLSVCPSDLSNQLLQTKQITELARQVGVGNPSDGKGKIFIVGIPRCGSTLLESILSVNSNICDLGESQALSQAFALTISKVSAKESTPSLSDAYTEKTKELLTKHTNSIDKNLYNFRFTEAIARAMPSARIIHCRRHPLDNILSMLRSNLQVGHSYTSDPLDAAKFLIHHEVTMNTFKSKYEKHIFTFDYDTFVCNPEKTLHPLIDWLGLKWNERYLHPETNDRLIYNASVVQARQPINSKSVGGWENYRELLKPAEEALIESGIIDL